MVAYSWARAAPLVTVTRYEAMQVMQASQFGTPNPDTDAADTTLKPARAQSYRASQSTDLNVIQHCNMGLGYRET